MKRITILLSLVIALTLCLTTAALAADPATAPVADLTAAAKCSAWAEPYLAKASEQGLIPESLLDADMTKNISREEFAELSLLLYQQLSGEAAAEDTQSEDTLTEAAPRFADCDNPYVIQAAALGLTNGMGASRFAPKSKLTREQGATMLTRVYKKYTFKGWTLEKDAEFENEFINSFMMPQVFSDAYRFSSWACTSIWFMRARSIIDGVGENRFDSQGTLTREQALKIAIKMLNVTDNPDFAPAYAYIVDSIEGSSIYTWFEDGQTVIALYDTDGNLLNDIRTAMRTEEAHIEDYPAQLAKTDYSSWYSGLAGLYHLEDGELRQFSQRPVKDLCFVRQGASSSGPIILTWADTDALEGIGQDGDTIIKYDWFGQEELLLSPADHHGIAIAGLEASNSSSLAFYSAWPVGMGHEDRYHYVLLNASAEPRPTIAVIDFEAGRPEVMTGFSYEEPEAYKAAYIRAEQQRLQELGLGLIGK